MDGRISALSAQIAELSKKIETVSSGSGGSSWAGELACFATPCLNDTAYAFEFQYNPHMWTVIKSLTPNVKFVNPTNRDCIIKAVCQDSGFYGSAFSSSHGDISFMDYGDFTHKAFIPVNKGGYISVSTRVSCSIYYLYIKN